jgi:hypothetical protein
VPGPAFAAAGYAEPREVGTPARDGATEALDGPPEDAALDGRTEAVLEGATADADDEAAADALDGATADALDGATADALDGATADALDEAAVDAKSVRREASRNDRARTSSPSLIAMAPKRTAATHGANERRATRRVDATSARVAADGSMSRRLMSIVFSDPVASALDGASPATRFPPGPPSSSQRARRTSACISAAVAYRSPRRNSRARSTTRANEGLTSGAIDRIGGAERLAILLTSSTALAPS